MDGREQNASNASSNIQVWIFYKYFPYYWLKSGLFWPRPLGKCQVLRCHFAISPFCRWIARCKALKAFGSFRDSSFRIHMKGFFFLSWRFEMPLISQSLFFPCAAQTISFMFLAQGFYGNRLLLLGKKWLHRVFFFFLGFYRKIVAMNIHSSELLGVSCSIKLKSSIMEQIKIKPSKKKYFFLFYKLFIQSGRCRRALHFFLNRSSIILVRTMPSILFRLLLLPSSFWCPLDFIFIIFFLSSIFAFLKH